MADGQGSASREAPPGVLLAGLLRGWWEAAGGPDGGTRPTQQALASRLGIDQTTLSRYLNRKHPSTAPPRVVVALHAQLGAPAAELEQARAWCRAALEDQSRQREAVIHPQEGAGSAEAAAGASQASGARDGRARGPLLGRRLPVAALTSAALVAAFAAGAVTQQRWKPDPTPVAREEGRAGAAPTAGASRAWPVLRRKRHEDQFTWGRALQYLLKEAGYELEPDGIFGDRTYRAVVDFQRENHLPVDGKVGRRTWPLLVRDIAPGDRGFAVRAAQELLDNAGQGATEVTGTFTATNAAEVSFFQQTQGLRPTGRIDTDTWLALLVSQSPPQGTPSHQRSATPSASASP
ncbi:peptidoglycan-binding protein [Streptomyces sp. DT224]|uniref:peptidoglycan-binding protein n=1 Tax=Streptomyces sp. DT224 TaxID=3393426 RepID=UPI003CF04721